MRSVVVRNVVVIFVRSAFLVPFVCVNVVRRRCVEVLHDNDLVVAERSAIGSGKRAKRKRTRVIEFGTGGAASFRAAKFDEAEAYGLAVVEPHGSGHRIRGDAIGASGKNRQQRE